MGHGADAVHFSLIKGQFVLRNNRDMDCKMNKLYYPCIQLISK
jgi:hypothetical protein